ncbi:serine/threonine-protein kinase [Saccharothrix obliqua]|uniref:serine/threonine-protein kinase n=1 Tax=Saccharothrix obliqua TaxID=2861747 RepID=UPI001C5E90C4|nr:serine/threonine-protein kinase [Saccharothrix obliqua]MBW4717108.1 serine/threonine protein kinase [Saccharothrix obliqua]
MARVVGDRYELVAPLDSGGMGRVWRARDLVLDVDVAVKEVWLSPGVTGDERARRLARAKREARHAAVLRDHRNVVAVHDVVVEDDVPWIVMRLVPGESLDKRLARGPLTAVEARRLAGDLLDALEAAHAAGIVHRDVKPANVLLSTGGDALLTDFGIAVRDTDTTMTAAGALIGSVEYMAPERLNGEDGLPESDLYSLGVTLFHAVEGISPFHRDTPTATITAVLLAKPPRPVRAGRLATLIGRLMERDPAARPTIAEARAMLATPLKATRVIRRPPAAPRRRPAPAKRTWPKAVAWTAVMLIVLLLFTFRDQLSSTASRLDATGATTTTTAVPTTDEPATRTTTPPATPTTVTTDGFGPSDLDDASTDDTPVTADALLPETFTDAEGVVYERKAGGTRACVTDYLGPKVRALLTRSGCAQAVTGTFVDRSGQVLVMVWVVPMKDDTTARTAYSSYEADTWGIICPPDGPGGSVCARGANTTDAVKSSFTRRTHRYLVHATALRIDLTTDRGAEPRLDAAAEQAVDVAGPVNHPGNR